VHQRDDCSQVFGSCLSVIPSSQVFYAALGASDSSFVKKLRPFQKTMEAHMAYLVERLPELSPKMLPACRELRAKFPGVRQ